MRNVQSKMWMLLFCWAGTLFAGFTPEEDLRLSNELSPEVKVAVQKEGQGYRVRVAIANPYAKVTARLGVFAGKKTVVALERFPSETRLTPEAIGGDAPLRLALEVCWWQEGDLRQRECFPFSSSGTELPANPLLWPRFDYDRYREEVEGRALQIRVPVEHPLSGKLTVVIEDSKTGARIRNLVSGIDYPAGRHSLVWDGYDERGLLVSPGTYRFRTASHPGIEPTFKMQYANGGERFFKPFGSNHGIMTAVTCNSRYVFAAAPLTEGGNAIIAMTYDGAFVRGYPQPNGTGIEKVFLACDARRLYVVHDGKSWSSKDRKTRSLTLTVYDVESAEIVPPQGGKAQYAVLYTGEVKEDNAGNRVYALAGAALHQQKLYVSNQDQQGLMVVDPLSGKVEKQLPLAKPGVLFSDGQTLAGVSDRSVVSIQPDTGAAEALFALPFSPRGLWRTQEYFAITGSDDDTVGLYDAKGKKSRSIGTPGGAYQGAWQPERLVDPVGVTVTPGGDLWVAEGRENPKRLSRWNLASGRLLYDKIGCPAYGSPGAGFDPVTGETWLGHGCSWTVDYEKNQAQVASVMQAHAGHVQGKLSEAFSYRFVHQDGRTFVIGEGKATTVSELMPDGRLRDLALLSNVHGLFYAMRWKRDTVFSPLVEQTFSKATPESRYGDQQCRYVGVLWVDRNANEDFDAGEIQLLPAGSWSMAVGGWGMRAHDLTLRFPYRNDKNEDFILTLATRGFLPGGAPDYSFAEALGKAVRVTSPLPEENRLSHVHEAFLNDSAGRLIVNSTPFMLGLLPDGTLQWLMENRWVNVHGSHDAPLPVPGQMQGNLFALGCAPLDQEGDVMVWIGNHGRLFVLTTDGLYLDEMFSDCRVAEKTGPGLVGGEPFGGNLEYDQKRKQYLLTAGTSGFRIYTLSGLDKVRRAKGTFKVTPAMLALAAKKREAAAEQTGQLCQASIPRVSGGPLKWESLPVVAKWKAAGGEVRVKAALWQWKLCFEYQVPDASPWVNNGKDWTQLFKSGDTVDLQLGTDAKAPANRAAPVPGDLRLSLAPMGEKSVAVLYRHRLQDKAGANPVDFTCPWRSERVDDVKRLESVDVKVERASDSYRLRAIIPLKDLGLADGKVTLRGDLGVIFGDRDGTMNLSRFYWFNKATGLVNDVPGEVMLNPRLWGTIQFE